MPYTIYRQEHDGTETIIGYAKDVAEASLMIDSDRDNVDWEARYRWHREPEKDDVKCEIGSEE